MWLGSAQLATAQVLPARPQRKAVPPVVARGNAPSVWRNQAASEAKQLPLSKQDRQAYENCPDPKRYARKHRRQMVRIW
ncbi:hypothetical protein D3Y59_01820 [Hymenobacter oligotrophus]|uniref:Uncharacterized protein n=1 Tax=Hymenobacter oligotrophus TaxID=2319843 RepID=A0A3B7RNT1_9BACT|nr:hypothetical protein D3Y59_01820 [Hymenobacter oligotrophus]